MFCHFPVLFIVAGTLISPKLLRVGTWVSVFFFFPSCFVSEMICLFYVSIRIILNMGSCFLFESFST